MATAMEVIDVPPYVSDEEEDMNASLSCIFQKVYVQTCRWIGNKIKFL
jgi:hypothetical protein